MASKNVLQLQKSTFMKCLSFCILLAHKIAQNNGKKTAQSSKCLLNCLPRAHRLAGDSKFVLGRLGVAVLAVDVVVPRGEEAAAGGAVRPVLEEPHEPTEAHGLTKDQNHGCAEVAEGDAHQ